jgi:uncharacterized cupredoxin-like copper-binding protein
MKLTRPIVLAIVAALALLGAATAVVVAHAGAKKKGPATITVTEKEFHLTLSTHKATAGLVRFVITNRGNSIHAFAISGTGVKLKKIIGIESGKTAVMNVHLVSGKYLIWCPMPGHATRGMRTSVTLPGHTAGTPPDATDTTGDTTTGATATSPPIPGY